LHDVGHLVIERPHFMGREIDNLHQYVGLPLLRRLFGPAVLDLDFVAAVLEKAAGCHKTAMAGA
jgi:predicted HD phosphohydrolase